MKSISDEWPPLSGESNGWLAIGVGVVRLDLFRLLGSCEFAMVRSRFLLGREMDPVSLQASLACGVAIVAWYCPDGAASGSPPSFTEESRHMLALTVDGRNEYCPTGLIVIRNESSK